MIKTIYDTKEDIPEAFRSLYSEKDGKQVLTGVEGLKSQADVDKVQEALRKEREQRKDAESKLRAYDGIEAEGLQASLDELERLRLTGGKVDDKKIEELVASRLELDRKSWERKSAKSAEELAAANERIANLVNDKNNSLIADKLREAAKGKVNESALNDVLYRKNLFEVSEEGSVLTRDGDGVTPGLEPTAWLDEQLKANPHWQKTVSGVGAKGSGSAAVGSSKERSFISDDVTFN